MELEHKTNLKSIQTKPPPSLVMQAGRLLGGIPGSFVRAVTRAEAPESSSEAVLVLPAASIAAAAPSSEAVPVRAAVCAPLVFEAVRLRPVKLEGQLKPVKIVLTGLLKSRLSLHISAWLSPHGPG